MSSKFTLWSSLVAIAVLGVSFLAGSGCKRFFVGGGITYQIDWGRCPEKVLPNDPNSDTQNKKTKVRAQMRAKGNGQIQFFFKDANDKRQCVNIKGGDDSDKDFVCYDLAACEKQDPANPDSIHVAQRLEFKTDQARQAFKDALGLKGP